MDCQENLGLDLWRVEIFFFFFKKVRIYKSLYDYYMYHNYCKQTNENLLSAQSSNICHLICQDVSLLL